jgi:hypothetical protein
MRFTSHYRIFVGIGFLGLLLCKFLDTGFYGGKDVFVQTQIGFLLVLGCSSLFVIGLLIMFPLDVLFRRKLVRQVQEKVEKGEISTDGMSPLRRMEFFALFGRLPKFIYFPVLAVFWLVVAVFVFIILGVLLFCR